MEVSIIYAYPNNNSYNLSILETEKKRIYHPLQGIRIFDLYKEKFDPVLQFDATYRRRDIAHDINMKVYRDL